MSGSIRIVDMPDLGIVTDDSSVVGEHLGSGRFSATALASYVTDNMAASGASIWVPINNPVTTAPGLAAFPTTDPYQSPDSYALTGSMTVRGQPYGYYDTGALLSLVSTTLPLSSSRAGINGGFESGLAAIAGYGTFDLITLYASAVASPPPLVLHSVTYDATHVFPHPPLTTAQIAKLRKNMWVLTNSIDTTVSAAPATPNGRIPETHYGSYVTGWAADGSSITVVGWTVPGSGHTSGGQVPPVGTLDPGASNATAYFGSSIGRGGANLVLQHNPNSQPDDRLRELLGMEIDLQSWAATDYKVYVQGIGMSFNGINGAKPTADSWGMNIQGFPTGILLGYCSGAAINSDVFNVYNEASPPNWAGTPLTNLTWEAQNYIDSDRLRLQCWTSRDVAGGGWTSASVHLGLSINGTPMSMAGVSPMAQLVWNPQGFLGGMQIQNAAGQAIVTFGDDPSVHLSGDLIFSVPLTNAANDAAAAGAGVSLGGVYRNGSALQIRVA